MILFVRIKRNIIRKIKNYLIQFIFREISSPGKFEVFLILSGRTIWRIIERL